jgi:hypothetical protein
MFQLTQAEYENLISQFVISKDKNLKSQFATSSWGGRRKLPFAFTEHGVIMLSSVIDALNIYLAYLPDFFYYIPSELFVRDPHSYSPVERVRQFQRFGLYPSL